MTPILPPESSRLEWLRDVPERAAPAARRRGSLATPARRLAVALSLALGVTLMLRREWTPGISPLLLRTVTLAVVGTLVFALFERWPRRLPSWLARWALQVVGVGAAMPVVTVSLWSLSTRPGAPPFWLDEDRMQGFLMLTFLGLLLAPWTALAALLRQREAFARHQALRFELERSELERQALDARLHLLQAQVAPHFLFNTLANVQALVDSGSPRASSLLRNLTAYLRAAVPLLGETTSTLGREVELAKAYLELMHTRMPDRLEFELHVDQSVLSARCPPTTLLTLVENAVRHGINPSEHGGRIEIDVERRGDRCSVRVRDSGVGLGPSDGGLGTGLATLGERLRLLFGDAAWLRVTAREPRGVSAQIEFPVRERSD